jgi:hypothetical protein
VLGLIGAMYFFVVFDTGIQTSLGSRVNNLGLMADRQNGIMLSVGVAIVGALFVVGASRRR